MTKKPVACFFTHEPNSSIEQEQYSIQDINILKDLGYNVILSNSWRNIPFGCDIYFSWWASGSILPLIISIASGRKIIVVAGGNETQFYRDSIDNEPAGYLDTTWYKKLATRIVLRFSSRILAVSNFMLNDIISLGAKNPMVVYNCVDTSKFTLSTISREFVLMIFKIDKKVTKLKRGEIFLKSIPIILKEYPNQKFVIIGKQTDYFSSLYELCRNLNITSNIYFTGALKNEEVIRWMNSSKVYVQISDTETFGVAIVEAMSCGTHVVVSKRGAIQEVVGSNGVYVNHNDSNDVAKGIMITLSLTNQEYNEISIRLRKRVIDNFSFNIRKQKIKEILNELNNE